MQFFLHILKFAAEMLTVLLWAIASVLLANTDSSDPTAGIGAAIGTLLGIVLFLAGLFFMAMWFLLVHFAHLPWWK